jgi:hypothetical protein
MHHREEAAEERHIKARLEYLRGELDAERISAGELVELQALAPYIDAGDVQLLEAAGVPENESELPQEFLDKRQSLAMFLLAMATGLTWEDAEGIDHYHENYTKDADDVIRTHPHLLTLTTREKMGLWP